MSGMGYVMREEGCNGGVLYIYTVLESAANCVTYRRKLSQKQKVCQREPEGARGKMYCIDIQVVTR